MVRENQKLVRRGLLAIGAHTYGDPEIVVYHGDTARVTIGRYCSIGADVQIFAGGEHRLDWITTYPLRARWGLPGAFEDGHPTSRGDVTVGHDVWIGRGAKVLSGVSIGNGAAIGAFSVVTRDVPPYGVAVGAPARTIRLRFDDEVIRKLQRLKWWNWPDEKVKARVADLCSPRVSWINQELAHPTLSGDSR